jgi:hypothetical protein
MSDSYLVDLAVRVKALSASPEHQRRRKLWQASMNLETTEAPVNFYMYRDLWGWELAGDLLKYRKSMAAEIESQLMFQLWRADHMPDDTPADPAIVLKPVRPANRPLFPWGVELKRTDTVYGGSYKPIPVIVEESDLDRIQLPAYEEDAAATARLVDEATELVGGELPVRLHSDELHWGPFEHAVLLRGMDNLLLDVYDRPEFIHRLMDRLTTGMVAYHKAREAAGRVYAEAGIGHVPTLPVPEAMRHKLKGGWSYAHAQSSASYSPDMYAEFVHPYNCRLADLVARVYYHGCEDLSRKCKSIKSLPGLRLFHVSPWTPPAPVLDVLGTTVAYEVHSHPTTVVFGETLPEIRNEIKERYAIVKGTSHTWALADVETFAGHFDRTVYWAQTAREFAR